MLKAREIRVSYFPKTGEKALVKSSLEAFEVIWSYFPKETISLQERFIVLYLNKANRVIGVYPLSVGGISEVTADIKLIFGVALKCAACSIILAHNHPSGNLQPSKQDISLTRTITEVGKMLSLQVLDHIIVSPEGRYVSIMDEGII